MWNYLNYFLDFIHPPIQSMKTLNFPAILKKFGCFEKNSWNSSFVYLWRVNFQSNSRTILQILGQNWKFKLKCQLIYPQELTTENFERAFGLVSVWKLASVLSCSNTHSAGHFHSKFQNPEQIWIFFMRKNLIWLHDKQKWNREQVQKSVHKTWRIQIQVHK